MTLHDWREADPGLLQPCYEAERARWQHDLAWDTARTWATVEQARVSWGLPGLLVLDAAGAVEGWTFYMRQGTTLHVGGLVARTEAVTRALVDGVTRAARREAAAAACFLLPGAPGFAAALEAGGFAVERYLYLSRALTAADAASAAALASDNGPWRGGDLPAAAALLRAAYPGGAGRHFAPGGTPAEWTRYVTGLVEQAGCGVMDPETTRVGRDGRGLRALALVTTVGPGTAHLAQVAVRPDCQGRGLGRALVEAAAAAAARAGRQRLTLLVGERNTAARRLYADLGFTPRAVFVAARQGGPDNAQG